MFDSLVGENSNSWRPLKRLLNQRLNLFKTGCFQPPSSISNSLPKQLQKYIYQSFLVCNDYRMINLKITSSLALAA